MAAKKIQPKKPAARTKSASGSKGQSKLSGRKTMGARPSHRKSTRKTYGGKLRP